MTLRLATIAAATFTAGAIVVAGVEAATFVEARAEVRAFLAGHRDLAVAGVSVDPWSGTVTIRGLTAGSGSTRVGIGKLSLARRWNGFGVTSPAQAAAVDEMQNPGSQPGTGSAVADDVVIMDGPTTYRLKHIELAGTSLSNADLAALLDPKSADSLEVRLRKLNAASIMVPELAADSVVGASEQHWTQKQILLANVVAGKVALGSAGVGTFAIKDASHASNGDIGGLQITNADLAQIAHVVAAKRSDESEVLTSLCDTLLVNALKVTDVVNNQTFVVASLKETGLKGRAFKDGMQAAGAELSSAKPDDPAAVAFLQDALHSLAATSIEAEDVASGPNPGDDSQPSRTFALSRLAIHDIGGGRIGAASLNDLRFQSRSGMLSIASAAVGDFTLPSKTPNLPGDAAVPTLDAARIDGIDVDMATSERKPDERIAFKVAHLGYAAPGFVDGRLPPKADLKIEHVTFDVPPASQAAPLLSAMGYKSIDVSSKIDSLYDADKRLLAVDKLSLIGVGMGSIDLKVALANVSNDVASQKVQVQKAAVNAVLIRGIDLFVHNDGLIDKAIGLKATFDGLTIVQERDALADFFAVQLPSSLNESPKAVTLGTAISAFVRSPKTLRISLASPNGLAVADLGLIGDPSTLLSVLDVDAVANE